MKEKKIIVLDTGIDMGEICSNLACCKGSTAPLTPTPD